MLLAFAVALTFAIAACSRSNDPGDVEPTPVPPPDAASVVRKFYERLSAADTSGMADLICPSQASRFQSSVLLLEPLLGAPGQSSRSLALEGFRATTLREDHMTAHVEVAGHLNPGTAAGRVDLADVLALDRDGAGWCLFEIGRALLPLS